MDTNKKAVAYVRISSQRQINHESPETQKNIIQSYADRTNTDIVKWFYDEAKSAKNTNRDQLNKMLAYVSKNKDAIDHVIVYKMNRLSRDLDTYVANIRLYLRARGITIRSATEPIDDTATGRLMENILIAVGQVDNEIKSAMTIDNMKSLAKQGYWQHPPIVGYETDRIENDLGKTRPTLKFSKMAPKVKDVLERFSYGDISQAELCNYAKKIGLLSRYNKNLGADSIHRLLKNPTYAGFVSDKFTDYELVPGKHPAIINLQTWESNQTLLNTEKSRKGEYHSRFNPTYPLRGLLLCANCDNPLYASAPRTGGGTRSPRYHCARKSCLGRMSSVKAEIVHEEFKELLRDLKPEEGLLKLYKEILIRETNRALRDVNSQIKNHRIKLDRIAQLRSSTIEKFVEGVLTVEEKTDLVDKLDQDKLIIADELNSIERKQAIRESDIERSIQIMRSIDSQWNEADSDLKQKFQNLIFPKGLLYDTNSHKFGTKEISSLYRYVAKEKAPEGAKNLHLVAQVQSNWNLVLEELARWKHLYGAGHEAIYTGLTD